MTPGELLGDALARVVAVDRVWIVLDKAVRVHSQPDVERGGKSLVDALVQTGARPHVVHRLDYDTSGLIVYALDRGAAKTLSAAFAAHAPQRTYRALLAVPLAVGAAGVIDAPLYTSGGRSRVAPGGERAVTHWRVERESPIPGTSELVLRLETGRTHQIRVHLAHALSPVLGDTKYGGPPFERLALHAAELVLDHPVTGKTCRFVSGIPWG